MKLYFRDLRFRRSLTIRFFYYYQSNKIYGGDAWTPAYPKIEHKINYKKASGIYSKANTIGNIPFFNPVNLHPDNIEDMIIRFNL